MFLMLVLAVVLAVALVVLLAMPRRMRGEAEATNEAFVRLADQLRPAAVRLDDATTQARMRRPQPRD